MTAIITRLALSMLRNGIAAATAMMPMTTRSAMRCWRRDVSRNAPIGPSTTAALRITSPPASVGHSGSRLCNPTATSTRPIRYSAAWCNQNGRNTRSSRGIRPSCLIRALTR